MCHLSDRLKTGFKEWAIYSVRLFQNYIQFIYCQSKTCLKVSNRTENFMENVHLLCNESVHELLSLNRRYDRVKLQKSTACLWRVSTFNIIKNTLIVIITYGRKLRRWDQNFKKQHHGKKGLAWLEQTKSIFCTYALLHYLWTNLWTWLY